MTGKRERCGNPRESASSDASPIAGAARVVCGRQQSVSTPSEIGHVSSDSRRPAAPWFEFPGTPRCDGTPATVDDAADVRSASTVDPEHAGLVAPADASGRAMVVGASLVASFLEVFVVRTEPAGCRGASSARFRRGVAPGPHGPVALTTSESRSRPAQGPGAALGESGPSAPGPSRFACCSLV